MKNTVKVRPILNFAHFERYIKLNANLFLCLIKHRPMKILTALNKSG